MKNLTPNQLTQAVEDAANRALAPLRLSVQFERRGRWNHSGAGFSSHAYLIRGTTPTGAPVRIGDDTIMVSVCERDLKMAQCFAIKAVRSALDSYAANAKMNLHDIEKQAENIRALTHQFSL
jgi:hypothetical protein